MLLKNFCKVITLEPSTASVSPPQLIDDSNTARSGATGTGSTPGQNLWVFPQTTNGSQYYMYPDKTVTYTSTPSASAQIFDCVGILLGTGTTAPTFNDYQMESVITTLTNFSTYYHNYDRANGRFTLTLTVVNNTSSDVTFSEIGLAIGRKPSTAGGTVPNYILLTRDVLPSAVTIEPNEKRTITITIDQFEFSTGYSVS